MSTNEIAILREQHRQAVEHEETMRKGIRMKLSTKEQHDEAVQALTEITQRYKAAMAAN